MNRHIFVLTSSKFPNGDALANYAENICKLARISDDEVKISVLAAVGSLERDSLDNLVCDVSFVKTLKRNANYLDPRDLSRQLSAIENSISENDVFIIFGLGIISFLTAIRFIRKKHAYIVTAYCERYGREYFDKGIKGLLNYLRFEIRENLVMPMAHNAIVVSKYLLDYCQSKGLHCVLIPPVTDTKKYVIGENEDFGNRRFRWIYSGRDFKKDRIDNIIKTFSMLPQNILDQNELHFTGISMDELHGLVDSDVIKKLDKVLIVHEWLTSEQYHALLSKMDFCIIARDVNRTTVANFPSKIPEYMSHGIIPVVSEVGDYTDCYLRDGVNCFLLKGNDPKNYCETVINVISASSEDLNRMRKNSRFTAESQFDYRNWQEAFNIFMSGLIH